MIALSVTTGTREVLSTDDSWPEETPRDPLERVRLEALNIEISLGDPVFPCRLAIEFLKSSPEITERDEIAAVR